MFKIRIILMIIIFCVISIQLESAVIGEGVTEEMPFGINNPYDLSASKEKAYLIQSYMLELGVKWVNANVFRKRVEPKPGIYDWSEPDFLVNDIFNNLDLVFNINAKTRWASKGNIQIGKSEFVPGGDIDGESFQQYKNFLVKLIKRYKDEVHQWMVFNEPVLEYRRNVEDYVKLMKISYMTIKKIDPKAVIYLGGVMPSTVSKEFLEKILPLLSSKHPVFGKSNVKYNNYFDGVDLHFFGLWYEYRSIYRQREKKMIYIEEFLNLFKKYGLFENKIIQCRAGGTYTGKPMKMAYKGRALEYQSERQQAEYLVKRALYLLSHGVKSAWSQIREREKWKGNVDHFNCAIGLIYNGLPEVDQYDKGNGVKKLSYWSYKFLIDKIKETDWKSISLLKSGASADHVYLFKIIKKSGQPFYAAWWDYFNETDTNGTKSLSIDVGDVELLKITETIPNAEWGGSLSEKDYPRFFLAEVKKVTNGKVFLKLGKKPIFIEIPEKK